MKKGFKSLQIFLAMAICLIILALPAYLSCANLSETKIVSSDFAFENPDQESGLPANETALRVSGPASSFTQSVLGSHLLERPSLLLFQNCSRHQDAFVLRC
jgi:hypothetical protein